MTTGVAFLLAAGAEEYATYALSTSPGGLPFGQVAVWLNNWIFLLAIAPVPLFLALFPTGTVASPRWRWLPRTLVILFSVGIIGTMLRAGTVDISDGADPTNPTGVQAITPFLEPLLFIVGVAGIALSVLAVVSLVLRHRATRGDERQKIRWIALVGLAALLLFLATIATSIGLEQGQSPPPNHLQFFGFFIMFGIGIPVAAGLAITRIPTMGARRHPQEDDRRDPARDPAHDRLAAGPDRGGRGRGGPTLRIPRHRPPRRDRRRGTDLAPPSSVTANHRSSRLRQARDPVRGADAVLRPHGGVVRDGRRAPPDGVDPRRGHRRQERHDLAARGQRAPTHHDLD